MCYQGRQNGEQTCNLHGNLSEKKDNLNQFNIFLIPWNVHNNNFNIEHLSKVSLYTLTNNISLSTLFLTITEYIYIKLFFFFFGHLCLNISTQ